MEVRREKVRKTQKEKQKEGNARKKKARRGECGDDDFCCIMGKMPEEPGQR